MAKRPFVDPRPPKNDTFKPLVKYQLDSYTFDSREDADAFILRHLTTRFTSLARVELGRSGQISITIESVN